MFAFFKPVIPLPEKVDVKTGEEEEEVLYCHRAKLFRFSDGEWKERGIGDVKILKDYDMGKLRIVMRREQVLKICLNHILTSDINYNLKDDKTWLFNAPDFSEGEIQHRQFCLCFKSADIAKEFKVAVNKVLGDGIEPQKSGDLEVEVVHETTVTPEQEQEALRLGLPREFMAYRQMEDCTCEECKKDDVLLKNILGKDEDKQSSLLKSKSGSIFSSNTTLFGTPLSGISQSDTTFCTPTSGGLVTTSQSQKTADISSALANITPQTPENKPFTPISKSETLKSLLVKPSLFSTSKPTTEFSSPSLVSAATPKTNLFQTTVKTEDPFQEKPIFSFSFKTNTPTSTSGIFGNSNPPTTIFGSSTIFSTTTQPSSHVFGSLSAGSIFASPITTKSIFEGGANGGIFSSTTTSGNIFGNMFGGSKTPSNQSSTTSVTTIFQSPSSNIFGTVAGSTNASLDKTADTIKPESSQSDPDIKTTTSSIFGSFQSTANTFGGGTIFGKPTFAGNTQATLSFGAIAAQADLPNQPNDEKKFEDVLTADANLSFSALAKVSEDKIAFGKQSSDDNPFAYLGAGAPVFATKTAPKSKEPKGEDIDHEASGAGDEEYDPHYEPIVPLPETIVVSTGEEDEQVIFNERVKLYRYYNNTKQWKECGVGQMKILHHPLNHTYRLLLRREQVHKVVLNQLITVELDLQPMSTSDIAWCWFGYNFTEDGSNMEKLAAKFKNAELSQQFYQAVQKAIAAIKDHQANKHIPTTVTGFVEGNYEDQNESANEDYQEDDYDEDEPRSIMFRSNCVLSERTSAGTWAPVSSGEIMVCYDSEIFGAQIHFISHDVEISNTMIGLNTVMDISDNNCTWRAVEWANQVFQWRSLQATFEDEKTAEAFHLSFMEGFDFAEQ